jgi:hypothetical protein
MKVAETYDCEVVAVLPYSADLATDSAPGLFVLENPDAPETAVLRQVAHRLVG